MYIERYTGGSETPDRNSKDITEKESLNISKGNTVIHLFLKRTFFFMRNNTESWL